MERILIIGTDSVAGRAIGDALSPGLDVTVLNATGISEHPQLTTQRLSQTSLQSAEADVIVFCGGASRSSWDPEFGDLSLEDEWLAAVVMKARDTGVRLAYISSDAVFGGPWVFHNDDNSAFADSEIAVSIRQCEELVQATPDSLIVRTNVIGAGGDQSGIACRILERLQNGESEHIDASAFGTPIAAPDFAAATIECLVAEVTGHINIGGAERATAWRLASTIATAGNYACDHLVPGKGVTKPIERSLRCERLRKELKITTPTLRETADHVVATSQQPSVAEPIAA